MAPSLPESSHSPGFNVTLPLPGTDNSTTCAATSPVFMELQCHRALPGTDTEHVGRELTKPSGLQCHRALSGTDSSLTREMPYCAIRFNVTVPFRARICDRPWVEQVKKKQLQCHRALPGTDNQPLGLNRVLTPKLQCHRALPGTDTRPLKWCFTLMLQSILQEVAVV